eukprot:Sspe_Gene.21125::Locus_7867_Transcript_1_1_Confidence_1.000_Length_1402::g.21125::m.21125
MAILHLLAEEKEGKGQQWKVVEAKLQQQLAMLQTLHHTSRAEQRMPNEQLQHQVHGQLALLERVVNAAPPPSRSVSPSASRCPPPPSSSPSRASSPEPPPPQSRTPPPNRPPMVSPPHRRRVGPSSPLTAQQQRAAADLRQKVEERMAAHEAAGLLGSPSAVQQFAPKKAPRGTSGGTPTISVDLRSAAPRGPRQDTTSPPGVTYQQLFRQRQDKVAERRAACAPPPPPAAPPPPPPRPYISPERTTLDSPRSWTVHSGRPDSFLQSYLRAPPRSDEGSPRSMPSRPPPSDPSPSPNPIRDVPGSAYLLPSPLPLPESPSPPPLRGVGRSPHRPPPTSPPEFLPSPLPPVPAEAPKVSLIIDLAAVEKLQKVHDKMRTLQRNRPDQPGLQSVSEKLQKLQQQQQQSS